MDAFKVEKTKEIGSHIRDNIENYDESDIVKKDDEGEFEMQDEIFQDLFNTEGQEYVSSTEEAKKFYHNDDKLLEGMKQEVVLYQTGNYDEVLTDLKDVVAVTNAWIYILGLEILPIILQENYDLNGNGDGDKKDGQSH